MNRRSAVALFGLGALGACSMPRSALGESRDPDSLLFRGDYETGDTAQFNERESSGGTVLPRAVVNPTRSASSKFAGAYQVGGSQYRCESVPAYRGRPYVAGEGSDLFFGWSVFFPEAFPQAPWQACGQWHQTYMGGRGIYDDVPPPMAFYVSSRSASSDRWSLSNNGQNPWQKGWSMDLGTVPRGEWTDVVVHSRFSVNAADCLVELWINGTQSGSLIPPIPTLYPTETPTERASYFKVGLYRDRKVSEPATVYFDNVKIGRTFSSVI